MQFMTEYSNLGHMVRITEEEAVKCTPRYYIPHHAVVKSNNLTTRLRVVFDASCKTSIGISLNDCLMVDQLYKISFQFYCDSISSFLAIRTMIELANLNASNYPIGSTTIINDFHVDDLLSGADTELEIKQLRDETIKILEQGGLQLRKWASNFPGALKGIAHTNSSEPVHFINKGEEVSTLGMQWNICK